MKKKILALCLVVALMATAIAGATLAYFNDVTEEVKNTFTMGKVDIELTEPSWEPEDNNIMPGVVIEKDPTITVADKSEDCYVFLDVTVNKFNSLAWVMAKYAGVADQYMPNGKFSSTAFLQAVNTDKALRMEVVDAWFEGVKHENWAIKFVEPGVDYMTIRLAYIGAGDPILSQNEKVTFMTAFHMPEGVTDEMIAAGVTEGKMANAFNTDAAKFEMTFKAHAIQKAELDSVNAAYKAMFGADPMF